MTDAQIKFAVPALTTGFDKPDEYGLKSRTHTLSIETANSTDGGQANRHEASSEALRALGKR